MEERIENLNVGGEQLPNSSAALVMGILSIACICCGFGAVIGIVLGILAIVFAKKAKTLNSTNTSELEDLGWHEDAGTWSAYKKEGSITTAWERLYPESEDPIEQRIYIRVGGATNIKQTGEGQRGETNPDIKKMFLVNEYFRYDGTQETKKILS